MLLDVVQCFATKKSLKSTYWRFSGARFGVHTKAEVKVIRQVKGTTCKGSLCLPT